MNNQIKAVADVLRDATDTFNGGYDNPVIRPELAEYMAQEAIECMQSMVDASGTGEPHLTIQTDPLIVAALGAILNALSSLLEKSGDKELSVATHALSVLLSEGLGHE